MNSRGERGAAAVEIVMLAPALLLLIAVTVGAGRMVSTKSALEAVAREAARAASDSADPASSRASALHRARETAQGVGIHVDRLEVALETESFERGAPVRVRLRYRVELGDLPAFGLLPRSWEISAEHTELLDKHRSR